MRLDLGYPALSDERYVASVVDEVAAGARLCGVFGSPVGAGTRLLALLSRGGVLSAYTQVVPQGRQTFTSLTPQVPAASWYERELQDMYGVVPQGHPRPGPLVLPVAREGQRPRPGDGPREVPVELDLTPAPAHVKGEGVFTLPYGPVRSGVFESVEYLVETPGEDIPHLRPRVFYKHRGTEARFADLSLEDGTLLAERYEGVASVAHAIAYCSAIEQLAGLVVPRAACLVRVVHAELERIANHLDSVVRHTEAAGQAVATARLSTHKERVQRLRAALCGSRFGRGVVVPGGVSGPPLLGHAEIFDAIDKLEKDIQADLRLLLATPSFIDRLRGTGVIPITLAQERAALGPVGRASGQVEDVRASRPYCGYDHLGRLPVNPRTQGDALARQRVRNDEIAGSFHLVRQATDQLAKGPGLAPQRATDLEGVHGEAVGWAEAPQGEVLYLVEVDGGRLRRVKPRSASFHNFAFFHSAFPKDIFTDFAFIEASFGLSMAGVSG